MPRATIIVVACCVLAYTLTGPEALLYHRHAAGGLWQLLSASFAHYDASHLASNLAGFAILGAAFERATGARTLAALLVATVATTMTLLHLGLDHYVTFAGISAVNYALLGGLLALVMPAAPALTVLTLSVAAGLQALTAQGLLPSSIAQTRATWELHLLAMLLGLGLGYFVAPAPRLEASAAMTSPRLAALRAVIGRPVQKNCYFVLR